MNADEIPDDVRELLESLPMPELPPVEVADILGVEVRQYRSQAQRWKWIAGGVAAIAFLTVGANAYHLAMTSQVTAKANAELRELHDRLAKLEKPADNKLEAKLNDIGDLLLTLAADLNDRDEKQRTSILALGKQLRELRSVSEDRWADSKKTTDALYILHELTQKETKR
jgi:hypothetical protein